MKHECRVPVLKADLFTEHILIHHAAWLHRLKKICALLMPALFLFMPSVALCAGEAAGVVGSGDARWAFIGAALAVGASTIGAGIAVGLVGAAAMGAVSERPEVAGRALIFLGLAEGIAIYGLIIAIMILGKI